jgi:hypothetical protein
VPNKRTYEGLDTTLHEPWSFPVYTATAERVEFKTNADNVIFPARAEGFQIVNSERPALRHMPLWGKTKPT